MLIAEGMSSVLLMFALLLTLVVSISWVCATLSDVVVSPTCVIPHSALFPSIARGSVLGQSLTSFLLILLTVAFPYSVHLPLHLIDFFIVPVARYIPLHAGFQQ